MSTNSNASAYLALAIPVLVAIFWCAIIAFISVLTGWHTLSRHFSSNSSPDSDARTVGPLFSTVYMRYWGHYSSVIRMTSARDALYLSVLFPFRPGHPPLRIPWTEIHCTRTKRFWQRFIELTLGSEEQIPFRISERMARELGLLERFSSVQPPHAQLPSWSEKR